MAVMLLTVKSVHKAMQFVLVTKSFKFVRKHLIYFLYMAKLYSTMSFILIVRPMDT